MFNVSEKILEGNIELISKQTFETATFVRRMMAYLIDLLIVIAIAWTIIMSFKIFAKIDYFFEIFEASQAQIENMELFNEMRDLFWDLIIKIYLIWIGSKLVYFTLIPAIIGNGRSVGKLMAGIGVVDSITLEEISPTRLMIREFVGRILVETILIIPYIVSIIMSFYREDSRSLHDFIGQTIVIRTDMFEADEF